MKEQKVLRRGDMFYYKPNRALGVLLEKQGDDWEYSLRSPSSKDKSQFMISIVTHSEQNFLTGIENNSLDYYPTASMQKVLDKSYKI